TRPEGLGGSRNAGPAVAGPRPPYVTEAHGYAVQRLRPYGPYGPYEGRNLRLRQTPSLLQFPYCFFFPSRTLFSTRFFRLLFSSSGFPSFSSLPLLPTADSDDRNRVLTEDLPWPAAKTALLRYYGAFNQIRTVLTEDLPWPAAKTALLRYYGAFDQIRIVGYRDKLRRHEARRPKTKDTIDWLEKHAFLCRKIGSGYGPGPGPGPGPNESTEHSYGLFQALPKEIQGLGGSRDAGPAVAGPRPPYVTEAVRHSGCTRRLRHGYAVQRLRPYGPYGPYEGRNVG
ncbi:hypothetical protein L249_5639, partial [Ophiocordyceps polyrhachis-furcata BCC 54312]